jgi:hypothetical protein
MAIYILEKSLLDTAIAIGPASGLKVTLFRADPNTTNNKEPTIGTIRIYYDQDLSALHKKGYTYKLVEQVEASETTNIANKAEKLHSSLSVSMPDDIGFSLSVNDQDIYQWYIKQKEKWYLGTRPAIPTRPTQGASREIRERFALDILNDFTWWLKKNQPSSDIDTKAVIAQWMYESNWGRSNAAQHNNLGGRKVRIGHSNLFEPKQYSALDDFYSDYMASIYNDARYNSSHGLKGDAYIEALKSAGYDQTDSHYVERVMEIYNQIFNK